MEFVSEGYPSWLRQKRPEWAGELWARELAGRLVAATSVVCEGTERALAHQSVVQWAVIFCENSVTSNMTLRLISPCKKTRPEIVDSLRAARGDIRAVVHFTAEVQVVFRGEAVMVDACCVPDQFEGCGIESLSMGTEDMQNFWHAWRGHRQLLCLIAAGLRARRHWLPAELWDMVRLRVDCPCAAPRGE